MQEKESIMVVRYGLKIPSLGITVRHQSASLMIPNSYPHDGIFSPHLTTIKDSYSLTLNGACCKEQLYDPNMIETLLKMTKNNSSAMKSKERSNLQ